MMVPVRNGELPLGLRVRTRKRRFRAGWVAALRGALRFSLTQGLKPAEASGPVPLFYTAVCAAGRQKVSDSNDQSKCEQEHCVRYNTIWVRDLPQI